MMKILELLWCFFCWCKISSSIIQCHNAYSCASTPLSSSSGQIECYGQNSCAQSPSISTDSSAHIYCYGSFSCYKATLIEHVGTTDERHIHCYGLYSCATVNTIYNQDGSIYCFGEASCANSKLTIDTDSDGFISCYGVRSCASSDLTVSNYVSLQGYLSGASSILRSGDSSVSWTAFGYQTFYGATLICNNSCVLYCNEASGCANLTTICANGEGTCSISAYCTGGTLKSDLCPDGYDMSLLADSSLQVPELLFNGNNDFLSTINNSLNNSCDGMKCDDYQECYNGGKWNVTGMACCTGFEACKFSTDIIARDAYASDDEYNIGLRADGYYSMDTMSGSISTPNGGHMYFAGSHANQASGSYITVIENNGNFDIIATGYYALRTKIIRNARDLYCLALWTCGATTISDIRGNIYGTSQSSLSSAVISNVGGNIYCLSSMSCHTLTVSNVGGNIIAVGQSAMYRADFTNINGTVLAYGAASLYEGTIVNVSSVMVDGAGAFEGGTIRGIGYLDTKGDGSMDSTTIVSEVHNGDTFIAMIDGTHTQSFDIYCNETDTCRIGCVSTQSCNLLNLHCFGTCFIDCESGFQCPNVVYGNSSDWVTTTAVPSFLPSMIPTNLPSVMPSSVPSNQPSIIPTNQPSSEPSSMPSGMPSVMPSSWSTTATETGTTDATDTTDVTTTNGMFSTSSSGGGEETVATTTNEPPTVASSTSNVLNTMNTMNTIATTVDSTVDSAIDSTEDGSKKNKSSFDDLIPFMDDGWTIIIIAGIVVCGIITMFGLGLLYCYKSKKQRQKNELAKAIELKKIEAMTQMNANSNTLTNTTAATNNNSNNITINKSTDTIEINTRGENIPTNLVKVTSVDSGTSEQEHSDEKEDSSDSLLYGGKNVKQRNNKETIGATIGGTVGGTIGQIGSKKHVSMEGRSSTRGHGTRK